MTCNTKKCPSTLQHFGDAYRKLLDSDLLGDGDQMINNDENSDKQIFEMSSPEIGYENVESIATEPNLLSPILDTEHNSGSLLQKRKNNANTASKTAKKAKQSGKSKSKSQLESPATSTSQSYPQTNWDKQFWYHSQLTIDTKRERKSVKHYE